MVEYAKRNLPLTIAIHEFVRCLASPSFLRDYVIKGKLNLEVSTTDNIANGMTKSLSADRFRLTWQHMGMEMISTQLRQKSQYTFVVFVFFVSSYRLFCNTPIMRECRI